MNTPKKSSAFILAAGMGTRMRPLSNTVPKPLLPIVGIPLIDFTLSLLYAHGVRRAVVNNFYLGKQLQDALGDHHRGVDITHSVEPALLGTGGGLLYAKEICEDPVLVLNSDTIHDIDLAHLMQQHAGSESISRIATMVVRSVHQGSPDARIGVDEEGYVCSILGEGEPQRAARHMMFCGVHLLAHGLLEYLPQGQEVSCIVRQGYIPALRMGQKIGTVEHCGVWQDAGTLATYKEADERLNNGELVLSYMNNS